MTTTLNNAAMTAQDAGSALFASRRSRWDAGALDTTGFNAALSDSADSQAGGPTSATQTADAQTPATGADALDLVALAGAAASTDALDQQSAPSTGAQASSLTQTTFVAGERLARSMAAAWLDASSLAQPTAGATPSGATSPVAGSATADAATLSAASASSASALDASALGAGALGASGATQSAPDAPAPQTSAPATQIYGAASDPAVDGFWSKASAWSAARASATRDKGSTSQTAGGAPSSSCDPATLALGAPQLPAFAPDAKAAAIASTAASTSSGPTSTVLTTQNGSTAANASSGADPVASIGAALSVATNTTATPAQGAASAPRTTQVHVVSQQSWLPPVAPQTAGDDNSPATSAQDGSSGQGASTPQRNAAQAAAPEAEATAAGATQPQAGAFAATTLSTAPLARESLSAPQAAMPASSVNSATIESAPTPVLRRDLEITLTPQDLGGLQVKLKSAGDRLELNFVADRGETARLISDRSAALESQLHGAGLGTGGVEITSSAAGGEAMQNGASNSSWQSGSSGGQSDAQAESETAQRRQESGRRQQDQTHETNESSRDARGAAGERGLFL